MPLLAGGWVVGSGWVEDEAIISFLQGKMEAGLDRKTAEGIKKWLEEVAIVIVMVKLL
jgi:hypothetical protein